MHYNINTTIAQDVDEGIEALKLKSISCIVVKYATYEIWIGVRIVEKIYLTSKPQFLTNQFVYLPNFSM